MSSVGARNGALLLLHEAKNNIEPPLSNYIRKSNVSLTTHAKKLNTMGCLDHPMTTVLF